MKTKFVILIIGMLAASIGCSTIIKKDAHQDLNAQLLELSEISAKKDADILKKEAEIIALQKTLNDKDNNIKEKEEKIDALRQKLKGFGVFE
ncbi:MAG: hypothetical protein WDL87_06330 [Candidatus Omnitrophota bacterium]|jgi:peptidoglycan hydrolase CwlO-like protein